jgi:hypothetical protein
MVRNSVARTKAKIAHGAYFTPPAIATALVERVIFHWLRATMRPDYTEEEYKRDFTANSTIKFKSENEKYKLGAITEKLRILDPGVGAGVFLLGILPFLERIIKSIDNKSNNLRLEIVQKHVFGWDIQPKNIQTTRIEIIHWITGQNMNYYTNAQEIPAENEGGVLTPEEKAIYDKIANNFQVKDSLHPDNQGSFSIIIGNPPYGNILTEEERKIYARQYQCRVGEISELFIERGLNLFDTRSPAFLCYIVPKTIAYYQQWARIRHLMLEQHLLGLYDLGIAFTGVNLEQLAFILSNRATNTREVELAIGDPKKKPENKKLVWCPSIPRDLFHPNEIFLLSAFSPQARSLIYEINQTGMFLPTLCGLTKEKENLRKFGQHLFRSIHISDADKQKLEPGSLHYLNKVPDLGKGGIDRLYYIASPTKCSEYLHPKLLFKVLRGSRLVVDVDPTGSLLTTEKVVNFIPNPEYESYLYGIAMLFNTRPPSFYLQAMVYSNTTESSRVLDPYYAQFIPVPQIYFEQLELLSHLGKLRTLAYYNDDSEVFEKLSPILELIGAIYYFPKNFETQTTQIIDYKKLKERIENGIQNLIEIAKITDFDEFYSLILKKITNFLPIQEFKHAKPTRLHIWTREISKKLVEQLLQIYNEIQSEKLFQIPLMREMIQYLGK